MLNLDDLKIELLTIKHGKKIIRITHINTGVIIEDNEFFSEPLIQRRNRLLKKLEKLIEKNNVAASEDFSQKIIRDDEPE